MKRLALFAFVLVACNAPSPEGAVVASAGRGADAIARLNTSSALAFASAKAASSGAFLSVMVMHMA